jgi:hypothetical protein
MFKKHTLDLTQKLFAGLSDKLAAAEGEGFAPVPQAGGDEPVSAHGMATSALTRIRLAAVGETLAFLALALGLDLAFGHGTRFINTPLHPFWIIILLVTVQYGPVEGVVSALLSSAFLLAGNMPEQTLSETMYGYLLRVSLLPFLWIMTALVLGAIRARQIAERRTFVEQLEKSNEASKAIIESYKAIKQSKERLELRLAEERRSVLTVYEVAKSLETLNPLTANAGIEQLVQVALNPTKFSLYRWKGNRLALEQSHGWQSEEEFTTVFDNNSGLVQQAMLKGRFLCITRKEDETLLDGQGILAGPIIDEDTGKFYGMLKIEEIGFIDIGIRTRETFRIISAWIAKVYGNVEAHQAVLDESTHFNVERLSARRMV